jgi:hypothetical protein
LIKQVGNLNLSDPWSDWSDFGESGPLGQEVLGRMGIKRTQQEEATRAEENKQIDTGINTSIVAAEKKKGDRCKRELKQVSEQTNIDKELNHFAKVLENMLNRYALSLDVKNKAIDELERKRGIDLKKIQQLRKAIGFREHTYKGSSE